MDASHPSGVMWLYILCAMGAGLLGALVALSWRPRVGARSAIQHLAAGVVIAAVALEVLPEVERIGTAWGILGGFAAGGVAMVALKWVVLRFEREQKRRHKLPLGLAAAASVDILIDGAITSAGFITGQEVGAILTAALAVELFFLTLSVGSEFRKGGSSWWPGLPVTSGIAAMFPLGALGGGGVGSHGGHRPGVRSGGAHLSRRGGASRRGHRSGREPRLDRDAVRRLPRRDRDEAPEQRRSAV